MSSPQDALEGGEFAEPSWQCQLICEMGTVIVALVGWGLKASQGAWHTVSAQFAVAIVTCRVAKAGWQDATCYVLQHINPRLSV